MIRVKIREEAERRGILTAYQLRQEFGFSPDLAARLWKGEKYPRLETLEKICEKWGVDLDALVTYAKGPAPKKRNSKKR